MVARGGGLGRYERARPERFIRTMLGGWAYVAIYRDSAQRTAALPGGWTSMTGADRTAPLLMAA